MRSRDHAKGLVFFFGAMLGLAYQNSTESRAPIAIGEDPLPPVVRAARNSLFDAIVKPLRPIHQQSTPQISIYEIPLLPELPVGMVDTIVVGKITGLEPRIFAGGRGIYSEFNVTIQNTLKAPIKLNAGTVIDIISLGGTASISGKVVQHFTKGLGKQIEVGSRYLFFLNYQPAARCFRIYKVWELRDGRARSNSDDDIQRVSTGKSTVDGQPEAAVIDGTLALLKSR